MNKTLIVAAAHDRHTLEAVFNAGGDFILLGDREKILRISEEFGQAPPNIINTSDDVETARKAVSLVREINGGVLMKGLMETATLLSAVLDRENGIRQSKTLSHIAVLDVPKYHKKITITDGGMCPHPTFEQKADILRNAVEFYAGTFVKVAVLSASEAVNPKLPESMDAAELSKIKIENCIIEGPLSFDIAIDREAAEIKDFNSRISGDADILLVPDITAGNILCKGLIHWAGAKMAGAVLGAKVPIILVSRGASAEEKLLSIKLCKDGKPWGRCPHRVTKYHEVNATTLSCLEINKCVVT